MGGQTGCRGVAGVRGAGVWLGRWGGGGEDENMSTRMQFSPVERVYCPGH